MTGMSHLPGPGLPDGGEDVPDGQTRRLRAGGPAPRSRPGTGPAAVGTGKSGTDAGPPGGENPGWAIFGYLIAGMGVYGGIGWLIGRWAGNPPAFLAGGMLIGLALAITLTIFRYGRHSAGGGPGKRR
jgi:ATP synthase protein I